MTGRYLVLLALVGVTTFAVAGPRRVHVRAPGFEMTPDGGSRLFVSLPSKLAVEERRAEGSLTYVLKGASVRVRNNTHALVTEHFNTPVLRAQLVPRGPDVHLVVELRATTAPTWKLVDRDDGTAALEVDFPAGAFVVAEPVIVTPIGRLEDPEDGPTLWPTTYQAIAPATDDASGRRGRDSFARGKRIQSREDAEEGLRELRQRMDEKRRDAQAKNPIQRVKWEDSRARETRPLRKHPTYDEMLQRGREQKRRQREAVRREIQELDRPGGAGTAVQVPENEH